MWGEGRALLPLSAALILAVAVSAVIVSILPGPFVDPHFSCREAKSKLDYFPAAPPGSGVEIEEFRRDWYSKHLRAMGEPSLACDTRQPIYRFLWLRTFHAPIVVRVEKRNDAMHLVAVRLDGEGGYGPGREVERIDRVMSDQEMDVFNEALANAWIWTSPDAPETRGLDGSRWIIEARDGSRYKFQDVWSPETGRIHALGKTFIALTGWPIPEREIY